MHLVSKIHRRRTIAPEAALKKAYFLEAALVKKDRELSRVFLTKQKTKGGSSLRSSCFIRPSAGGWKKYSLIRGNYTSHINWKSLVLLQEYYFLRSEYICSNFISLMD